MSDKVKFLSFEEGTRGKPCTPSPKFLECMANPLLFGGELSGFFTEGVS
jgi:hypothetical protein